MYMSGNTAQSGTTPGAPLQLVDMSSHLGQRAGAFLRFESDAACPLPAPATGRGRRPTPHAACAALQQQPRKRRSPTRGVTTAVWHTCRPRAHAPPSWTLRFGTRPGVPMGPPGVPGTPASGQGVVL